MLSPSRLLVAFFLSAVSLFAQQPCAPIPAPAVNQAKLIFNPQQEMDLGDAVSEHIQGQFLVIEDPIATGYLRHIGERVVKQLPASNLQFQFFVYDQPEIQSFGLPGGRIYVSRKMVAFLRSEDELAGLLGHELGHLVARQQALAVSRLFHDYLAVDHVGDRDDIFEKYNQVIETARVKNHHGGSPNDEKEQIIADQIGVEAVARAGYSPKAYIDLIDRIMQTKGKTGSWFSDVFGTTKPDEKRLREVLRNTFSLPAACVDTRTPGRTEEFQKWQTEVLRYGGIGHGEQLHGILTRTKLNNPLRGDVESFRFSPDGKYLLAKDDSGIDVLTREPLEYKFRIDAVGAGAPQFSPDSRQIVFARTDLRVETWDVDAQERSSLTDVPALRGCRQTALSPDARFLACFGNERDLSIYNVASSEVAFRKERFYDPVLDLGDFNSLLRFLLIALNPEPVVMRFSPDGRYFAATSPEGEEIIFDLSIQKKVNIPGSVRIAMTHRFAFIGPDSIVGVDVDKPDRSPVVKIPSGEVIDRVPLGGGALTAATTPRYLLIRPIKEHPVGCYDLAGKKFVVSNRMSALDVWEDWFVSERLNGEIGLYKIGKNDPTKVIQLPLGKLGQLTGRAVSSDLKWLAVSNRTRGAIWNLDSNDRSIYVRGFQRAYSQPNALFYLDFPQFEKAQREFNVVSAQTKASAARIIEKEDNQVLAGDVIIRTKRQEKERDPNRNFQLEILDTAHGNTLWKRDFPKRGPAIYGAHSPGRIILAWSGNSDGVKQEFLRDPALKEKWSSSGATEYDYFVEVLDGRTGNIVGSSMVRTGKRSFSLETLESAGNWLVAADSENRVLLFSLSGGQQKAHWFGANPVLSADGTRLCISNERGQLRIYDLQTFGRPNELIFANHVSVDAFSGDSKKLFVLTDDQTAFVIDLNDAPATPAPTSTAAVHP
ncbi:MAG TPA: M48 family metalloprotease [Candidatus Acidoferrum sp.]|jgi:WD40 repeat protein